MKKVKYVLVLIGQVIIAVVIFTLLSSWQEREMLETSSTAPKLSAQSLKGDIYQFPLTSNKGTKTLVYFFAPWCNICHLSIGNLNLLRGQIAENELDIIIVALDWTSKAEVEQFMTEHELQFPVILGTPQWQQLYKIQGFPSYYLLNPEGEILSRSMGYSTTIGMLRRSMLK